jgi:hypothetical protein
VVAVVGLVWTIASHFVPKAESAAKPLAVAAPLTQQSAEANGGTAINATGAATVAIGNPPAASASAPVAPSAVPASQSAKAGSAGTAVNAADSARVVISKP